MEESKLATKFRGSFDNIHLVHVITAVDFPSLAIVLVNLAIAAADRLDGPGAAPIRAELCGHVTRSPPIPAHLEQYLGQGRERNLLAAAGGTAARAATSARLGTNIGL